MKKNKYLQKLINKLVDLSLKEDRIIEGQVTKSIKILKSLPQAQAIDALSEYLRQLKRKEREHTLYIETAIPLTPEQIKKMKKIVEKKVKITKVLVNSNTGILGGFKIRIGDEIWDDSISGRIEKVKEVIQG
ncbi:MAG: hypothetical protein ACD_38C00037G0005 [uncultured bacterium]|uniref:Uncharacterized protein n=1 Tax=Candidatus Daviesbacteria bacterium GW2011_GWC2_40_12 TaxID=1618431 RepID=A0A0G0QMK9_9BACT|nr:MAG: hypothetical protein ACD_38C00037G0005 [uncultured bacterium]KKR15638.1 MAG: hypothetical protein UT45_C0017G0024 [Candidatus Daviesbacteria bacterium GW2011_GWA2_39_33]KKR23431.1 MAG: hypothetical protein UT54_C0049G0006 [Candidatus Daviesbacteria bacterium GW2011_GWB1_39_5]KKR41393.1 MAG: hypothetical protein UT77_C0012G0020 [Candidatus Daviesbacteria bacterium GW2011_GWC2_40_12]OGE21050.1 MAG: hypothetical protein A2778_02335 [Candidatus Daviesbacteria bacterium RIFCSPHIGHO2_01_FULL_